MSYKQIDGRPTIWKGQSASFFRRIVYAMYRKYVDEVYIPDSVTVRVVRVRQKNHPRYGKISHLLFVDKNNPTKNDYYLFTKLFESVKEERVIDETV